MMIGVETYNELYAKLLFLILQNAVSNLFLKSPEGLSFHLRKMRIPTPARTTHPVTTDTMMIMFVEFVPEPSSVAGFEVDVLVGKRFVKEG